MKTLVKTFGELQASQRWDIDFHAPAKLIRNFKPDLLVQVSEVADIIKRDNRNPKDNPEEEFLYIDISSVSVTEGSIVDVKPTLGAEAPSRARKVVKAFDIIVSTVRPTRGAVAVVPTTLHDSIASTGYSIVRAHEGINPYYLHFALRLASTKEQFRKWSTGSSYPAILDEDVAKTLIPVPSAELQDKIASLVFKASQQRQDAIRAANDSWKKQIATLTRSLSLENQEDTTDHDEFSEPSGTTAEEELWSGEPEIKSIDEFRRQLGIFPPKK